MVKKKSNFWKNKKILITGFSGFLGSWLTKTLLNHDAKVYGLDIVPYRKPTILSPQDLARVKIIKGSVENFPLVSEVIEKNKIEFIFHLAAKALVGECLKNPLKAFSSNIKGTWNVLEASRSQESIKSIVVSSSDKAYGIQNRLPYKEVSPLAGCHPYDVSKSCADLLAHTYFHTFSLPVCVTRCGNIFGPGDFNFSRIIPDTIRSAVHGKILIVRSDGKFTRDYIYVEDVVNGYLLLARTMHVSKIFGEAFNFSNEEPVTVLHLIKNIYQLAGRKPDYKVLNQAKYEIRHQYLSSQKAHKTLGWKPKYTLNEGLQKTIGWYKEYFENQGR
ncbi:MAG: GDP-mannose 4,6-dehydratase [Candidatus Omnitrophica bacterium]|nr:GDP-mannose 4,6-dehydratase [Candidatus Omnitrophota bacterium]